MPVVRRPHRFRRTFADSFDYPDGVVDNLTHHAIVRNVRSGRRLRSAPTQDPNPDAATPEVPVSHGAVVSALHR